MARPATIRGAWPYDPSPPRPSTSLDPPSLRRPPPSAIPSASRFPPLPPPPPPPPYFSSPAPAPSISALTAAVGHPSFLSDFASWQQSPPQNVSADFADSPLGTPYSETSSVDGGYYVGAPAPAPAPAPAASHTPTLGYPESSQRTHLPDAAYASLYARYDDAADAAHVYPFPDLPRAYPPALVGYGGPPAPSLLAYPPTHTAVQSALYPLASRHPFAPSSQSLDPYAAPAALLPQSSPVLSSFYGARPSSADAHTLDDPGSPSGVPPLVFDGDAGDDYENDSEYSLPSASSEPPSAGAASAPHSRPYAHAQSRAYGRDQWPPAPSYDPAAALDDLGSPASQDSHFEPQSPSPSSDRDFSAEHPDADQPSKAHHPKKSKMHQCSVCDKWFPRPSGLATHMNSHSGARPFKCPIPSCSKSFAVRSNAKRHLRTHGIYPTCEQSSAPAQFTVGFDAPIVSDVPQAAKLPAKLRWVPQSLATRTNVDHLRDVGSDSEDEYPPSCPVVSVPLPAVMPSSPKWNPDDRYHEEERNSYEQVGASPYLTSQWRALPGPAIVSPPPF